MEDNIYLDKVIEFLVRDTRIEYDEGRVYLPFPLPPSLYLPLSILRLSPTTFFSSSPYSFSFFSKYCKVTYGLTEQEIEYVWDQYKDIILDKISNK